MRFFLFVAFLSGSFFFSIHLNAENQQDLKSLRDQINNLEKKISDIEIKKEEGKGRVGTFLSERINLGGFFEHAITYNYSPDASYELSANLNILALNISAELNDQFILVTQPLFYLNFPLNNENDVTLRKYGTGTTGAFLAHAYGEYRYTDALRIQLGMGWIPFGIAAANRELPLYLRQGGPQIANGGFAIPTAIWTGVHLLGDHYTTSGTWGYDLYTVTPSFNTNRLGGGSRLWWRIPGELLTIGTSQQIVKRGTSTSFNFGGDLEIKLRPFGLRAEYGRSFIQGEADTWTTYGEPYIEFDEGKWIIHGEIDYRTRPMLNTDPATFAAFERIQYGGGVNWIPLPFLKARLLLLFTDYLGASSTVGGLNNDFFTVQYSTAIEF